MPMIEMPLVERPGRSIRRIASHDVRKALAAHIFALTAFACGSDSPTTDITDTTTGADATGEAESTTDGAAWPPDECPLDQSPFLRADCLGALQSACRELTDETACAAEPSLRFIDDQYVIRCVWAKVVTFSDATACTVAAVMGRCEASVDTACSDACAGEPLISDLQAIPSELEIVKMCGGPIGPWAAVGSEPGAYVGACAGNVTPPAPPLCDCAAVACAAE